MGICFLFTAHTYDGMHIVLKIHANVKFGGVALTKPFLPHKKINKLRLLCPVFVLVFPIFSEVIPQYHMQEHKRNAPFQMTTPLFPLIFSRFLYPSSSF